MNLVSQNPTHGNGQSTLRLAANWVVQSIGMLLLIVASTCFAQTDVTHRVKRINEPGPITGVVVHINLHDPRVEVVVAPAGLVTRPELASPTIALDTTSQAARLHDLDVALNASFFAAPNTRAHGNRRIAYFVGNDARPVGWHLSSGQLLATPRSERLRATVIAHADGRISIADHVTALPEDARHAVSGNALLLSGGENQIKEVQGARAPRSAVGLTADGKTLLLLALDGRSEASKGMNLHELAELLKREGAADAINLDGGGSTTLVLKNPATGVQVVTNRPSDLSTTGMGLTAERAVADVIGVRIKR